MSIRKTKLSKVQLRGTMLLNKSTLKISILTIISILCLSWQAHAQQCPQGKKQNSPKPVGMINSSNGGVYKKGEFGVIFKYQYGNQDDLYEGSSKVDFEAPVKGQKPGKKCKSRKMQKMQMTLRYGILENLDARLIVPYLDKEMKRDSFNSNFEDSNHGIGDIKLVSRYSILSQKKKNFLNLAVGAGIQMPTGETDSSDDKDNCLPGYLQTGSGSWDPIVELGAHKVMGRHWISTYFMFKKATMGKLDDRDFQRPDVFKYNLGYAYALSHYFDLQLELNGVLKNRGKLSGSSQENSGGHTIYITPGIHFKFYKKMHLDFGVPITIYRDLNGIQPSEDYSVLCKLALKF